MTQREEDSTDPVVVVWLDTPHPPVALVHLKEKLVHHGTALIARLDTPAARRWVRRGRKAGRLGLTLGLAIIPGTLLLAVAVLVWHRMVLSSPMARPSPDPLVMTVPRAAPPPVPPPAAPPAPRAPSPVPTAALAEPSCSAGRRQTGPLHRAAQLPTDGKGHAQLFPHRNLDFGTDEMIAAIERIGTSLAGKDRPPLMVLNLSGRYGPQAGHDPFHDAAYNLSHSAGRAVDFAFFVRDPLGREVRAVESKLDFDDKGRSKAGVRRLFVPVSSTPPDGCHRGATKAGITLFSCPVPAAAYQIDFDRTWKLVRAILTDPDIGVIDPTTGTSRADGAGVRFIFVSKAIEKRLLEAAIRAEEPEALRKIAKVLLHAPSDAPAYDSYLHLDIWCTDPDRANCGCDDSSGPWNRWRAHAIVLR